MKSKKTKQRPRRGQRPQRLDLELVRRGLAESRQKAQALIMAGQVSVDGQLSDKSSMTVLLESAVSVWQPFPYVSRGALKIERAIQFFGVRVDGIHVLDIGISTGGFSDWLLQHGAAHVTGVDVTVSQVDSRLRSDPRVRLVEKNARHLEPGDVTIAPDLIVVDLSFISLLKVLPALAAFPAAAILALVKPQFEAEKGRVGKGGVVRRLERRREILLRLKHGAEALGFVLVGVTAAGVTGKKGNQEYFFLMRRGCGATLADDVFMTQALGEEGSVGPSLKSPEECGMIRRQGR